MTNLESKTFQFLQIAAVSVTVGVILLGVLAQYLRKKKSTKNESRKSIKRPMLSSAALRECQANDGIYFTIFFEGDLIPMVLI